MTINKDDLWLEYLNTYKDCYNNSICDIADLRCSLCTIGIKIKKIESQLEKNQIIAWKKRIKEIFENKSK